MIAQPRKAQRKDFCTNFHKFLACWLQSQPSALENSARDDLERESECLAFERLFDFARILTEM